MDTKTRLGFVDLFAGCGGLSEGFMTAGGFRGLAHVEWELPMVNTLRKRLESRWGHTEEEASKRVIHFDVQRTHELLEGDWCKSTRHRFEKSNHADVVRNGLAHLANASDVDVIIGGPPCQAYSIAGRAQDANSMEGDYRNYLFESFLSVVKSCEPEIFVFENVPGMLSARPGGVNIPREIYRAFDSIGYQILPPERMKTAVFDVSEFGVPQARRRLILFGVKKYSKITLANLYKSLKSRQQRDKKVTVRDAIGHFPAYYPIDSDDNRKTSHESFGAVSDRHHSPRYHNKRDQSIFSKWVKQAMNKSSLAAKLDFYEELVGKRSTHAKYRSLEWDRPSPTIVAHLRKDGLMFIHPDASQARSITVREAAALQSFPDDYEFVGAKTRCYQMIGNAVPPLFAHHIACAVYEEFENAGVLDCQLVEHNSAE